MDHRIFLDPSVPENPKADREKDQEADVHWLVTAEAGSIS